MSFHNWGQLATAGLAAVLTLYALMLVASGIAGEGIFGCDNAKQYRADGSSKAISGFSLTPRTEADFREPNCASPQSKDYADLCQQRRAADSAAEASCYAGWQTAIAFFGLIGIAATVFFAWRAVRWAKEAAEASHRMVDEARASSESAVLMANVMVGIEVPVIQVRPVGIRIDGVAEPVPDDFGYAAFSVDTAPPPPHAIVPVIPFRNYGRTPAFPISIALGYSVVSVLSGEPVYTKSYPLTDVVMGVEPQESPFEARVYFPMNFSDEQRRDFGSGAQLWLYGSVKYRDFMNNEHEARFCCRWAQEPGDPGNLFWFSNDGNPPEAYTRRT
jgi:hypothetical protein